MSLVAVLFILCLTFFVYYPLRNHAFLNLDDSVYVFANPQVTSGLSWSNIRWAMTTFRAEFWHPLTWFSYMVDTELFGMQPGGYLLTNILLHLLNTLLVFYLFRLFFQRLWESVLIAALFALHPLHVEPVAWISERKELLCAFFWLLALLAYWFYVQSPGWRAYLAVMVCFVLGFMAKSMIITLPFLLLVLDYWPFRRDLPLAGSGHSPLRVWWRLFREKMPLLLLMAAGIGITLVAQKDGGGVVSLQEISFPVRLANALVAYAAYVKNTLWPMTLCVFYPVRTQIAFGPVIYSAVLLIGLSGLFIWGRPHRRLFLAGWLWFLGTLVPVIGLVQFGDFFMADRFMYMPILGLFVIMAGGLRELIRRLPFQRLWLLAVPLVVVGVYTPRTWLQIQTWRDSQTLYTHALQSTKGNYLAHHALGETFARKGNLQQAAFHFSRAAYFRPDKAAFWIKLGRAQAGNNDWPRARACFSRAVTLQPAHPKPRFYLGCAMLARGNILSAIDHLTLSLKKIWRETGSGGQIPASADYYYQKGREYDRNNQDTTAIGCYQQAVHVMPGFFPAVKVLTRKYLAAGKTDKALALYGLSVFPDRPRDMVITGYDQWKTGLMAVQGNGF